MSQPRAYALAGATALLGTALDAVPDSTVIVEDDRITSAGARGEIRVPDGIKVYDLSRMHLVPGFIDAHVHIDFYEPEQVLVGGVTTVRDLAWPPEEIWPLVVRSE